MRTALSVAALALGLNASVLNAAYTIDAGATSVGDEDVFLSATKALSTKGSNPDAEADWVQSILGPDVEFTIKTEDLYATSTDQNASILALVLDPPDDFYVIKNARGWALFENVELMNWGVFDTTQDSGLLDEFGVAMTLGEVLNLSDTRLEVSHISLFNGDPGGGGTGPIDDDGRVPLPHTWALLALGGVIMGAVRRTGRRH
jgi:hypothetical protein